MKLRKLTLKHFFKKIMTLILEQKRLETKKMCQNFEISIIFQHLILSVKELFF